MNVFDEKFLLWLNGFAGRFEPVDDAARLLASDYLIPLLISLTLFGAWFAGRTPQAREFIQRRVLVGAAAIGACAVGAKLQQCARTVAGF